MNLRSALQAACSGIRRMGVAVGFLSASIVIAVSTAHAQPDRPPQALRGYFPNAQLPTTQPQVIWKYTSPVEIDQRGVPRMTGLSDATVRGETIYFGDDHGTLHAFRCDNGNTQWTHAHGFRISHAPTVDDKFVYFGSDLGVSAVDRSNGKPIWFCAIEAGASEATPLSIGDRLFFSAYDGFAYALDRTDGGIEWRTTLLENVPPDPEGFDSNKARFGGKPARPNGTGSDGTLLFQSMFDQSRLITLRCDTGQIIWTFPTKGWIGPAPTVAGDRVLVGCQDHHLYCLNKADGELLWKFATGSRIDSRTTVVNDKVFLPSTDGHLYCLRVADGTVVWKFQTTPKEPRRTAIYSAPIVTEKSVYFATGEGQVYAVDVTTGQLMWKLRPSTESELYTNLATDGRYLFAKARQGLSSVGECAIIAIGNQ